jgi:cellulose synthase (UDP-forming)
LKKYNKILGMSALIFNILYLFWLYSHIEHQSGWILFFVDTGFTFLILLYLFNHSSQFNIKSSKNPPSGSLDVFLPVVNEPLALFERTLMAATQIYYTNKTIYVLDDGRRDEVEELAKKYSVKYLCRGNNIHFKAGNLNFGMENSVSDFILILDADHIVQPEIAEDLLGHFFKTRNLRLSQHVNNLQCLHMILTINICFMIKCSQAKTVITLHSPAVRVFFIGDQH